MAKMHSRKRGNSGSKRPAKKVIPSWIRYKPNEIEHLVVKISKEGKTPSQIGMTLRDVYGIPDIKIITKKSITAILEEKKILAKIPEDLMALIRKSLMIRKHLEENSHDQSAVRGLLLTDSKIGRLAKYYKRNKKIDADWKFEPERVNLYVE
jgi:small subunit ribosomal protein S15